MQYGFDDNKAKVPVEALKLLKDYGLLNTFAARDESISNLNDFDFIDIEVRTGEVFRFSTADDQNNISSGGLMAISFSDVSPDLIYLTNRSCHVNTSNGTIDFGDCYCRLLTASQTTKVNDYLIPRRIYGVKI